MEMVNGYVFLDLTKANVYQKALKVLGADKPVVISDGSGAPYFVDTMVLDGTSVVITKGGKTITIANDNTITNVGDIQPLMENIVDLQGNKRFIEGTITTSEITGLTMNYAKFSLSGTHLMLVLSGSIDNTVSFGGFFGQVELPDYIIDKIYPVYGSSILKTNFVLYSGDGTQQNGTIEMTKDVDKLRFYSTTTANADKTFRIQIDLLIDAE